MLGKRLITVLFLSKFIGLDPFGQDFRRLYLEFRGFWSFFRGFSYFSREILHFSREFSD